MSSAYSTTKDPVRLFGNWPMLSIYTEKMAGDKTDHPPRPTQPPIPLAAWKMSTSQRAVKLCSWEVKTGMINSFYLWINVWVAGNRVILYLRVSYLMNSS